jgi:hypothetical protein
MNNPFTLLCSKVEIVSKAENKDDAIGPVRACPDETRY